MSIYLIWTYSRRYAAMEGSIVHIPDLDCSAREVVACYPAPFHHHGALQLGNRGGFSGAVIFRVENLHGTLCLRAWPVRASEEERLHWLHQLLNSTRDAGLAFVPRVFTTTDGRTAVRHAGRLWELQEWMPGRADFHERRSGARLEHACIALAQLHGLWDRIAGADQPCPAIRRRLETLSRWDTFVTTAGTGFAVTNAPLCAVAVRARAILPNWLPHLVPWLGPWVGRPWPLQPCLCDVWHDHVLFEGDRVSGIIDYGAVKVDHAAVDLARMLGSLVEDDEAAWRAGLAAYRSVRPFGTEEEQLAHVLDVTGTVLGIANWLMRIAVEKRTEEEQGAVARRLETLVRRVEGWETKMPLAALQ